MKLDQGFKASLNYVSELQTVSKRKRKKRRKKIRRRREIFKCTLIVLTRKVSDVSVPQLRKVRLITFNMLPLPSQVTSTEIRL